MSWDCTRCLLVTDCYVDCCLASVSAVLRHLCWSVSGLSRKGGRKGILHVLCGLLMAFENEVSAPGWFVYRFGGSVLPSMLHTILAYPKKGEERAGLVGLCSVSPVNCSVSKGRG